MSEHILAVCDRNEKYAMNLSTLIMEKLKGNYSIITFTGVGELQDYASEKEIDTILITESAFESSISRISVKALIILYESQDFVSEKAILINRFQSREDILNSVLKSLPECEEAHSERRLKTHHWKIIGIYSPIRRCLQTTFAMTLGQMLAAEHRVLYMNFENYSGFSGMFNREFESDILDILYFADCDSDKISRRLPLTVHTVGGLDILPPPHSYLDTADRSGEDWKELFKTIEMSSEYEYLLLDLTDAMHGILDVLGICDRIYTMTKSDSLSQAKIAQYEQWMRQHSEAEIMSRTLKFELPVFTDIPEHPEMLTKSELAGYIRAIVRDDIMENFKEDEHRA